MSEGKHSEVAKNFFLYVLLFALLYMVAINFGGLVFDLIDKAFPILGTYRGYASSGSLRFHLAALIIGTPFFLFLSRYLYKASKNDEYMRTSGIRRWLTYITVLITTLIVVGDLIALVYNLLGGETTTRFVLKAVTIFIISGGILYYYIKDVQAQKHGEVLNKKIRQPFFLVAAAVIVIGVIAGFFHIESPTEQRMLNNDTQRVNDLQQIEYAVQNYVVEHEALPESLEMLRIQSSILSDPITEEKYEYNIISEDRYELCASFEVSTLEREDGEFYYDTRWLHDDGRDCFERSIDDEMIKVGPRPVVVP